MNFKYSLLLICYPFLLFAQTPDTVGVFILKEIVVTDFVHSKIIKSSNDLDQIKYSSHQSLAGIADLSSSIKGVFVDASMGEVFSKVYTRGVSLSAEDDIGWYYNSLMEDGLPVVSVQYQQFSPDFFIRPFAGYERIEYLKGGKTSIIAQNAPGMLINLKSRKPLGQNEGLVKLSSGIYDSGRMMGRIEGYAGGPISKNGWFWDMAYMYRYDQGPRETDYGWNNGGLFKLGLSKIFKKGLVSLNVKHLNDKVNRYTGVAAVDWDDPKPAFDQSFHNTSLLPPDLDIGSNTASFNPKKGIQSKELAAQINLELNLGDWILEHKSKYSAKSLNWETAIGGQPLGLDNFITYFISGDAFPAGLVEFREAQSGKVLALVNNVESFNVFQGLPPGFEYLSGSLPNDAIMGSGSWLKNDQINEFVSETRLSRKIGNIDLTSGLFYARSSTKISTKAGFIYTTYEANPRALQVRLTNPGAPARELSDQYGLSNYDGLFYQGADILTEQLGLFGNANWEIDENWTGELGLRWQNIAHEGTKDFFSPDVKEGGQDGNPLTAYDNGVLKENAKDASIDFQYPFLNTSLSMAYKFNENSNIYARYSLGHKSPELNYYINNYSNIPVSKKGKLQKVEQWELGYKMVDPNSELLFTAFYSNLSNVSFSEFVFDEQQNRIFFSPTQFNSARTLGVEALWVYRLSDKLSSQISFNLQDPKSDNYTIYRANGTIDEGDDEISDFSNMQLPHNPSFFGRIAMSYSLLSDEISLDWQYMGKRYGNIENSFRLPAYHTTQLNYTHQFTERLSAGLKISNLFNNAGLANFFGPNQFGSNANAATTEYIQNNPNASFTVFPIMPRAVYFNVSYGMF